MAGIFSPNLQSQVTPESPTEMASPLASIAQLGTSIAKGLGGARDRADREARASAPSYTQLKDEREAGQLSEYSTELQRLEGLKGQISAQAYNLELRKVNMNYLDSLADPSFVAARETITGLPDEMVGRTDNEILINSLSQTPIGQAEISFAAQQLEAEGVAATPENVASVIRQREVTKLSVTNMQITDEASFRQAKPALNQLINMFTKDTQNSVFTLREAGVPVTGAMVQDRYADFLTLQTEIIDKIPANVPETQKEDVLKSLGRTEDFFVQLGMTQENGKIILLNKSELQVQEKVRTYVSVLNESEDAADNMLALQIMDQNYRPDAVTYGALTSAMARLGTDTPVMPDWITEADIIVTNDLIGTYTNLVEFEQSGGREQFTQDKKMKEGAISLVNPEEQAKWSGMTNAQGWTATKAFGTVSNGFSKDAILSGQMTDGFYNSMAGLALSFESIDIVEEPISFKGLRSEVSSKLPDLIKTAEAVDPVKGAAIKYLMFRSLTTQRFQYDTRLASDESKLGVSFNPQTRTYNLTSNTSDPAKLTLINIVNNRYNGDLVAATQDGFSKTASEDLSLLPSPSATQTDMNRVVYTLRGLAPQVDKVKDLLDLRSSAVYLSNLASQIEPQSSKDAREAAQESATSQTQNNGVQSTTASLIERYESGRGGYDTLFGQAQGSGGPFEGFNVSQKTLGELYEFSNPSGAQGTYGAYVKATNPKEVLATPMGRFQFVGTTLKDVAKKMGLPDDTVFNKETQDAMFLSLARDVMAGKSQEGKIKALRGTWDGFNSASDAELIQMIAEVEGGNPNLGGGGSSTPEYTPRITTTVLPPATTEGTTSGPASAPVVGGQGGAPVESVQATAALPEEVEVDQTTTEGGSFGGQGLVRVIDSPAYSRELQALLQALRVDPEQTFIVADLDEFDAAVAEGLIKKGDEVVVGSGEKAFVKKVE